jgi:hypothetical protein
LPVAIFLSIFLLAGESIPVTNPIKPKCDAKTAGELWPAEANKDRMLSAKLARCGELQICVRGHYKYRWESPTVRVDQLSPRAGKPIPAECDASAPFEKVAGK